MRNARHFKGMNEPKFTPADLRNHLAFALGQMPPDAEEGLSDWYRERDRIQHERDAEEREWKQQEGK